LSPESSPRATTPVVRDPLAVGGTPPGAPSRSPSAVQTAVADFVGPEERDDPKEQLDDPSTSTPTKSIGTPGGRCRVSIRSTVMVCTTPRASPKFRRTQESLGHAL
jgi:hypothetical protein